jgi:ribosomal protein L37AE/L43A
MMTGPADQACPGCGDTTGVQPTPGISPRVKAWSCTACQTDWATTTVNPQPYFDRLAATVEQLGATRSVLRTVITLAGDSATLSDKELRDRLLALAVRARLTQHPIVQAPKASHCPARLRPAAG